MSKSTKSMSELVKANEAAIEAWAHANRGAVSYNGGSRPEWELARHYYLGGWVLISRGAHAGKFGIATRHIESAARVNNEHRETRPAVVEIITSTGERVRCAARSVSRLHAKAAGVTDEALADATIAICHTAGISDRDLIVARNREYDAHRQLFEAPAVTRDMSADLAAEVRDLQERGRALRASWFELSRRLGLAANLPRGKSTRLFWADFAAWVAACGAATSRASDAFEGALH